MFRAPARFVGESDVMVPWSGGATGIMSSKYLLHESVKSGESRGGGSLVGSDCFGAGRTLGCRIFKVTSSWEQWVVARLGAARSADGASER